MILIWVTLLHSAFSSFSCIVYSGGFYFCKAEPQPLVNVIALWLTLSELFMKLLNRKIITAYLPNSICTLPNCWHTLSCSNLSLLCICSICTRAVVSSDSAAWDKCEEESLLQQSLNNWIEQCQRLEVPLRQGEQETAMLLFRSAPLLNVWSFASTAVTNTMYLGS